MSEATDGQRPRIPLSPPSTNRKSILPPFEPGRSSSSFSTPLPSSSSSSSDMSTDGGGGGRLQQQQLESGYSSNNKAATSSSSGDDEDVGGARRRGNIGRFPPPGGGGVGKAGKGAGDGASYSFGTGGVAAALRSNQGILPRYDMTNFPYCIKLYFFCFDTFSVLFFPGIGRKSISATHILCVAAIASVPVLLI